MTEPIATDGRPRGYCSCGPHDYPMRDCGIPEHRADARALRRTPAPELSAEERARVARFDAAPDLPESWAGQQRMASGYAQARDRLAVEERRQALTGLRDEVVAGVERALLVDAVVEWMRGLFPLTRVEAREEANNLLALPEMRAALRDQP